MRALTRDAVMSEWWTYSLSDFLLFSPRTYYRLFELYNLSIWPTQLAALAAGLAILWAWRRGGGEHGRLISALLAVSWLWIAWAYLLGHYDTINWTARHFAMGFALQTLLMIWAGFARNGVRLRWASDTVSRIGLAIFLFALLLQPLIGPLIGRPWTQMEIFGVAPDPTVVATLGVLLAADRPHWVLLIIPLLWCAISGATLWTMQSPDALVMPAAALLTFLATAWKMRRASAARA
jgi:Family of unknown function (DUF6064)